MAEVLGERVTRRDLSEALRAHLWTRDQTWADLNSDARKQTREIVLDNLVNGLLIRAARLKGDAASAPPTAAEKREAEMQRRQIADPAEFPRRLAAQQQTPASLAASISEAQRDEAWISRQIQPALQEITPQQIRAWYDQHKEAVRIPPAYHAAHLFLTRHDPAKPNRAAEIRELRRQFIAQEKTFAQLVAAHSDDARTRKLGGDLGWFTHQRMPADFIAAVEQLKIGQCSEPVATTLGWHLILLMERRPSRLPTFEEARAEIAAQLTGQRRAAAVQRLIATLRQRQGAMFYHAEAIDHTDPAP